MSERYDAETLIAFAANLFAAAGLDADKSRVTAEILVEGDLLGHTTHGLALLGQYLDEAEAGRMLGTGAPDVVAETPVAQTWDGKRLPGPWLVMRAAEWASARARTNGLARGVDPHELSHRLPRGLSARHRRARADADHRQFGSFHRQRGSVRRHAAHHHAQPARRRMAVARRPGDDRRLDVHHHQRHDGAPACRGAQLRSPLAARRQREGDD